MRTLEGKRLSLPSLPPEPTPAPPVTPRSEGAPEGPGSPGMRPRPRLPSAVPEEAGGAVGRVAEGPLTPLSSLNRLCFPLSFLSWLQSTYRCGAVGHNQGAQVRNGAWQPLACTRLPESNFPVITLPNFSASVKDRSLWSYV